MNTENQNNPMQPKGNQGQGQNQNLNPDKQNQFIPYVSPPSMADDGESGQSKKSGRSDIAYIGIIAIIAALIVSFVMNSFLMPTIGKKQYINDITRLENDLVAMREVETNLTNKIKVLEENSTKESADIAAQLKTATTQIEIKTNELNNLINSKLSGYVSTNEYNTKLGNIDGTLNSIKNSISDLNTKISTLNSQVDSNLKSNISNIQDSIDKLSERIKTLEDKTTNSSSTSSGETKDGFYSIATWNTGDWYIDSDNKTLVAQFKVKFINNTPDIVYYITADIEANWDGYAAGAGFTTSLKANDVLYTSSYYGGSFRNVRFYGASINPGKTSTDYIELRMTFNEDVQNKVNSMAIMFDPIVDITNYRTK